MGDFTTIPKEPKFWPKSINASSLQAALPKIENKTESLRPVKIEYVGLDGKSSGTEVEDGSVRLQIKNTSTKTVIGYVLTFGSGQIEVDLLIGGGALAPGEIRDQAFSTSDLIDPLNRNERLPATIALVVFDDHTTSVFT